MALQTINLGTAPNTNTGDDARSAGAKINANDTYLEGLITSLQAALNEWHQATGTRAGSNLVLKLGDFDSSGNANRIEIDDGSFQIKIYSQAFEVVSATSRLQDPGSTKRMQINIGGVNYYDGTYVSNILFPTTQTVGNNYYFPDGFASGNVMLKEQMNTLALLNAILTDATLIDTNDSRLSDARTPTAHNHTVSEVTDFDSNLAGKTNTTPFTPTQDHHVATKKYVDDNAGGGVNTIYSANDTIPAATARTVTVPSDSSCSISGVDGGIITELRVDVGTDYAKLGSGSAVIECWGANSENYINLLSTNGVYIENKIIHYDGANGVTHFVTNVTGARSVQWPDKDGTVAYTNDFPSTLAGTTNTTAFTPTADYHVATKKYVDDNISAGDDTLSKASDITANSNALIGHIGGMNEVNSATDVTITVQANATEDIPVGTILMYRSIGVGNVVIAYSGAASGDTGQTYYEDQVITLWHKSLDSWVIINPPLPQFETIEIPTSDLTTDLTTGTSLGFHRMTFKMKITELRGVLMTAGTTTGMTWDVNVNASTILSTKLTTDATETTSETATTAAVLTTTELTNGDVITVDHDAVPTGGKGSAVQIIGYRLRA